MKSDKKAFTVIELLIVICLFGIFMSMIGTITVNCIKAFHRSRYKLVTQQEAQMSIDRLCRELNESYLPGVKIKKSKDNGGHHDEIWDAICFPTSRTSDDATGNNDMKDGKLKWTRYVIYFKKNGQKEVYRRVIKVTAHPENFFYPEPLTDEELEDFLLPSYPLKCPYNITSGSVSNDRKIAGEIYSIKFDLYSPDIISCSIPVIHIFVESRVKTGTKAGGKDLYEHTIITTFAKPENN